MHAARMEDIGGHYIGSSAYIYFDEPKETIIVSSQIVDVAIKRQDLRSFFDGYIVSCAC